MKHVSIQTQAELLENLNLYEQADTKGREPDKDYIFRHNVNSIQRELARRAQDGQI